MPRPLQIMLVDDSPFDRGMVRRELRQAFHEVDILEVMDEHQLRAALDAATFDAVITDFQIRWTDGLRVLRSVKERLPECPVIMFTATGSEEIAVEAMKSGLDDYVIKNAQHMVRLRTAIQSAVKHRQTRIRVDQLQSRLESLLSHLRVGVFRRKPDGTIVEANDAAAAILGHSSSDELIGRKLEHYLDQSSRPVQSGLGTEDSVASATRIDGKSIWFAVSENVATGDDGEVLLEGLLEDVSDRKEAEAELLRLQDEMAHVSRISVMAEMAAGISHELHQPLNVMCTYAAVSRQKIQTLQDAPPELMEWLQQIHDLAYESAQVIRGLLEFTLKRPREPRPTLIGELIRDTLKMVQFDIRKAQVSLDLQLVDPDISVVLDRFRSARFY